MLVIQDHPHGDTHDVMVLAVLGTYYVVIMAGFIVTRRPAAFTMIECGRDPSKVTNDLSLVVGLIAVGGHRDSSIRAIDAPTSMPAVIPSPWSSGDARVHSVPVGLW